MTGEIKDRLRIKAIAACVALAACGTDYPARDLAGRAYPDECRRDLSWVDADVRYVSRAEMLLDPKSFGGDFRGVTYYTRTPPLILIRNDQPERIKRDVLRHELCHVVAGAWHAPDAREASGRPALDRR